MTPLFSILLGRHTFFSPSSSGMCSQSIPHRRGRKEPVKCFPLGRNCYAVRSCTSPACTISLWFKNWDKMLTPSKSGELREGLSCARPDRSHLLCSEENLPVKCQHDFSCFTEVVKGHAVDAPVTPPYSVRCCAHQPIG